MPEVKKTSAGREAGKASLSAILGGAATYVLLVFGADGVAIDGTDDIDHQRGFCENVIKEAVLETDQFCDVRVTNAIEEFRAEQALAEKDERTFKECWDAKDYSCTKPRLDQCVLDTDLKRFECRKKLIAESLESQVARPTVAECKKRFQAMLAEPLRDVEMSLDAEFRALDCPAILEKNNPDPRS